MALRNLSEHKGKTLIIGTIIALGVGILLVGNALMDTAALGIERSFIDNYTGHIMISGTSDGAISLFGVQTVGGIDPTPTIPDYSRVFEIVSQLPGVVAFTPQLTGFGLLRREADESDDPDGGQDTRNSTFTLLFGIEPQSYQQTFSNIQLVQGRYLESGERGILLSMDRLRQLYRDSKRAEAERERARLREASQPQDDQHQNPANAHEEQAVESQESDIDPVVASDEEAGSSEVTDEELFAFLSVGDSLRILGGFNQGLPRIRVVPVVGIYEQANEAQGVGSDLITFVDAQTLRALLNLNVSAQEAVLLRDEETALLRNFGQFSGQDFATDLFSEELFGDDLFGSADELFSTADFDAADPFGLASMGLADGELPGIPSITMVDESRNDANLTDPSRGAWHYILIRLEQGNQANRVIAQLNRVFAEANIDAQASNWEAAAGPFAQTADVIRTVFNISIIIIGVVAILIMMNTMVISVIERTSEIGTMRALGAQSQTIRNLFLWETLVITTVFGVMGMLFGLFITGVLNIIGIPANNTFLQVLFAGPVLRPRISLLSLVYSLGIVSGIGILAHLYPVSVAVKIPPVRAMQSE
jgi:ABC-type lipoprotein release transport system permease subunit